MDMKWWGGGGLTWLRRLTQRTCSSRSVTPVVVQSIKGGEEEEGAVGGHSHREDESVWRRRFWVRQHRRGLRRFSDIYYYLFWCNFTINDLYVVFFLDISFTFLCNQIWTRRYWRKSNIVRNATSTFHTEYDTFLYIVRSSSLVWKDLRRLLFKKSYICLSFYYLQISISWLKDNDLKITDN